LKNRILKMAFLLLCISLLFSCVADVKSEYQDFVSQNFDQLLFILNGDAESISAYDPQGQKVYQNLQLVGHQSSSEAWPNDLLYANESLYAVCSGQNSVERYNKQTLDFLGSLYLKNGFNPMTLCPLGDGTKAAIAGYESDEIVIIDLIGMNRISDFVKSYSDVILPEGSHRESRVSATDKNACGENHKRHTTSLAAKGTILYGGNVRYDTTILLTNATGELISYEGSNARAAGYFREGTLSVFEMSPDYNSVSLVREINLQDQYSSHTGKTYFPGDGLNPQSLFVLNNKLHIICTGTNGGSVRTYTDKEYIPEGYRMGDPVPGTDPDDGVALILNLDDPLNPSLESVVPLGGSPVGFRNSMDSSRKILYLAGVGGVQSYNYESGTALHTSKNLILAGRDPSMDFYSYLLFEGDCLYISDYSHDKLNRISVTDAGYDLLDPLLSGDGPGALVFISY